jgi:RNA polymerase sigma-70 factor (ECF subfamily)
MHGLESAFWSERVENIAAPVQLPARTPGRRGERWCRSWYARRAVDDLRTDLELIEAIRAGDDSAFESLYLRHRDWAYRVARRFLHDDGLAMDAVQQAFLYLHRKGRGLMLSARFTTFLYPVIRHEAQRLGRKARRDGTVPLESAAAELAAIRGEEIDDDGLGRLRRALAALPESQREALVLAAVDGMTHGQISIALGVPMGTVKSRIHAALGALRGDGRLVKYFEN